MRAITRLFCVCLPLAVAVSCVPEFPPASRLDETPQVLAVRAEPPTAAPGQTLRLDALVHWPGLAAAPEHLWLLCRPTPADTIDTCVSNRLAGGGVLLLPCESAPSEPLCFASRDATALFTVPADLPTDADGHATIFVELVVGDDVDSDECVRAYRDLDPSERCLVALKRLTVSAPTPIADRNVNPTLAPLVVNGEPADASALVVIELAGVPEDDLEVTLLVAVFPESVDELDGDEPPDEARLPVAWYTTCGSLNEDTDNIVCEPPLPGETTPTCEPVQTTWKPNTSGDCTVHVTLRDNGGGVDWITQHFVVGN